MTLRARLQALKPLWPASYAAAGWLRTGAAFVATLALFGLLYAGSVAWRERVVIPLDPPAARAPEGGSRAVAAAAAMLSLAVIDPARESWFAPAARKRRAAAFQDGAADAVSAFVEVAERSRRGRDPDFDIAFTALTGADGETAARYAAARDALRRVNARGDRRAPLEHSTRTMAALARAAAAQMRVHRRALAVLAVEGEPGHLGRAAEAAFYRARGSAYAWRVILGAYGADIGAQAPAPFALTLETARAALARAAAFEPAALVNPLFGGERPLPKLARRLEAVEKPLEALDAAAGGEGL